MKNKCLLVHCILSFKGTSYKRIQGTAGLPVSCCFTFLTFTEKRFLSRISFFNGLTETHHPLAKRDKCFLLMLPKFGKFLVFYLGCGSMTYFHNKNDFTSPLTHAHE